MLEKLTINSLINSPSSCIFALVNTHNAKRIQIFYTNNFTNSLMTHLYKLQNGLHENKELQADLKKLEVIVIETFKVPQDIILLKYIVYNTAIDYRNNSYTVYRMPKRPNGKLIVDIESENRNQPYKAIVKLKIGLQHSYIIKVCDSYNEAKRITTKSYGNNTKAIETLLRCKDSSVDR